MDFLFLKKISLLSLLLSFAFGAVYIQVSDTDLSFDYKDGDIVPIFYYLNIKNIGPQPARFDVSSSVPWIFVYREGLPGQTSLTLSETDALNFVLEIHPEKAENGSNLGKIIINAVNLNDLTVMETKEVNVVLNKNIQITTVSPEPLEPKESPSKTASISESIPETSPALTKTPEPTVVSPPPQSAQTPIFSPIYRVPKQTWVPPKTPTPFLKGIKIKVAPAQKNKGVVKTELKKSRVIKIIDSIVSFFRNLIF